MHAVLDASVLISCLSPKEIHHAIAKRIVQNPEGLVFAIPSLFRVEVLSGFARRFQSSPRAEELLQEVEILLYSPLFQDHEVSKSLVERAAQIVKQTRLRAYDSIYVALSEHLQLPFVTFDAEIRERVNTGIRILDLKSSRRGLAPPSSHTTWRTSRTTRLS